MKMKKYVTYIGLTFFVLNLLSISIILIIVILEKQISKSDFFKVSFAEVERVTSPDHKVDAVVRRMAGNATVGFSYDVFIVPRGLTVTGRPNSLEADHVNRLKVRWVKENVLEVEYVDANINEFSNHWYPEHDEKRVYPVKIKLKDIAD